VVSLKNQNSHSVLSLLASDPLLPFLEAMLQLIRPITVPVADMTDAREDVLNEEGRRGPAGTNPIRQIGRAHV